MALSRCSPASRAISRASQSTTTESRNPIGASMRSRAPFRRAPQLPMAKSPNGWATKRWRVRSARPWAKIRRQSSYPAIACWPPAAKPAVSLLQAAWSPSCACSPSKARSRAGRRCLSVCLWKRAAAASRTRRTHVNPIHMKWGRQSGPRGYHHGNLKEALVRAALELIAEKGPAGFTFADAARSAGVSPAAPYRHFRDRDELLADVARRGFEQFAEALAKAWDEGRPDVMSAFDRLGKAY